MTSPNIIQMPLNGILNGNASPETKAAADDKKARARRRGKRGWYSTERANGRWIGYAYDPQSRKYEGKTFDTKQEADAWAEARHGLFVNCLRKLGKADLQTITDSYVADLLRLERTDEHIGHFKDACAVAIAGGLTDLNDTLIARQRLVKILAALKNRTTGGPASPKTKNNLLGKLITLGNHARRFMGVITENPFEAIRPMDEHDDPKGIFTLAEVRQLVDPKHKGHAFYLAFCSLIYTGFRIKEMTHLEWEWFKWDENRLFIQIQRKPRKKSLNRLKNGARFRVVRLMPEYAAIMRDAKPENATGQVFPDLPRLNNDQRQRLFNRYLKDCGVEVGDRTPHSTRHTWTCMMLASDEDDTRVRDYAGHTDKDMTEHYGKMQDRFVDQIRAEKWTPGELSLISPPKP